MATKWLHYFLFVLTFYLIPADERIFPIVPEAVQHVIKSHADRAGVKRVRVLMMYGIPIVRI